PVTTIKCILDNKDYNKIIALNFANANIAGGAYIFGGNAQEESLCRASMLYYTIKSQKKYYWKNRLHILPDYTDNMIYSKNVPVIRYDSGEVLENPVVCNFITSPAVNRTFAKFIFSDKNIVKKMTARINKIISLAVSKNPDLIVLGAFGCGVFGNRREVVFKIFENAVNRLIPDNIKIIFAVPNFKSGD
ncbi:MAG: TIGR02452 family protein, partial [Oscillospiraceae bacterium]|nr:TIGR02452 family protein [Oscillospiraceae bacterium]